MLNICLVLSDAYLDIPPKEFIAKSRCATIEVTVRLGQPRAAAVHPWIWCCFRCHIWSAYPLLPGPLRRDHFVQWRLLLSLPHEGGSDVMARAAFVCCCSFQLCATSCVKRGVRGPAWSLGAFQRGGHTRGQAGAMHGRVPLVGYAIWSVASVPLQELCLYREVGPQLLLGRREMTCAHAHVGHVRQHLQRSIDARVPLPLRLESRMECVW